MEEKAIIVGDLHHQKKEPKCFQVPLFFEWLSKQPYYNKNNILILLGDLVESVFEPDDIPSYFIDLFLNVFPFKEIIILEGNHDKNLQTSLTDLFRPIPKVRVISEDQLMVLGKTSFLFLPHYDHEGTDMEPMHIYYNGIHEKYTQEVDYCCHHLYDETAPGKRVCDLSGLKVKKFRAGHIHLPDVREGGHYLGSVTLNSSSESGKTPLISVVNLEDGKEELISVPKFLEYREISYPENLLPREPSDPPYFLYTIKESLSKKETLEFYNGQAKKLGYQFYPRKVFSKKVKEETKFSHEETQGQMNDIEFFGLFKTKTKMAPEVASILEEIISKK